MKQEEIIMNKNDKQNLSLSDMKQVTGGIIVDEGDGKTYWVVRQDGTVFAPAPSLEKAQEFAKTLSISPDVLTKEEYEKHFGRPLKW